MYLIVCICIFVSFISQTTFFKNIVACEINTRILPTLQFCAAVFCNAGGCDRAYDS